LRCFLFYSSQNHLLSQLDDGEDVFELLDENEYQQLVEKRREGSDFVVDDGWFSPENIFTLLQKIWAILTMVKSISG
jgi:hypothetical protein